ncbi:threonine/homoserine/homoserine lactone efflux protein [Sulfitobacter undariae]|uniref:Threonine/homoserine/homoserine lactone efflux protein n=1 Tax=Sulfitobacter undariae TaxID=1563671 RepID=A0A7W6E705_9RHOB|nr:LysE family translocator [Sulfitobacter undariae]MBB3993822.1 threonine/homoserine/homoserine lactone efflux protein [Sulfitobacter undariae]
MTDLTLAQLIAFNLTLLAAMASPGPAFLLVLRNSMADGRRAGILTGLGLSVIATVWTSAALLGLAALFDLLPWLYGAMKLGGAIYLLYLAWSMWRGASQPLETGTNPSHKRAFRSGVIVNISNPKSVLFAGAVIVVIFPSGLSLSDSALIITNHFIVEITVYSAMAFGLSTPRARAAYLRVKTWADRIASGVMAALGLRLLLER